MIRGLFIKNVPYVQITLAWKDFVKDYWFILDTGFTGDLQLPTISAQELKTRIVSVVPMTIANGETINVPHALAIASVEHATSYVQVAISNGAPLLGINFLSKFGYKAIVDCKHKTVILEKV